MRGLTVIVPAVLLAAGVPMASGQDQAAPSFDVGVLDIVDEVRVGGHFHNVYWTMLPQGFTDWNLSHPGDLSFDVLFRTPDHDVFRWLGSPRPEVGLNVSLSGYEHMLHFGLTWQVPVLETPFYLEGTFGGAAHTGYLTGAPGDFRNMGCRVNFYERFGAGVHVNENVTATLTYEHSSNNDYCAANAGLSNFGLRLGWKF